MACGGARKPRPSPEPTKKGGRPRKGHAAESPTLYVRGQRRMRRSAEGAVTAAEPTMEILLDRYRPTTRCLRTLKGAVLRP